MGLKLFVLTFFVGSAQAFTLNNNVSAAFDKNEVKINVDNLQCTNLSTSPQEFLYLAQEAAERYWNTVPNSRLRLAIGGLVDVDNAFNTDLVCSSGGAAGDCHPNPALKVSSDILIACNNNATNYNNWPSVLGVSLPNNIVGRNIQGALILINDNASNVFDSLGREEKIAVIAHELGHAVGLGHSQFDYALMWYQSVATRRNLGWDDAYGLAYLYPTEQPISGCGTISTGDKNLLGFLGLFGLGIGLVIWAGNRLRPIRPA